MIAGALGPRAKGVPPAQSWYAAAASAMDVLHVEAGEGVRVYEGGGLPVRRRRQPRDEPAPAAVPAWAYRPAPQEARPPRPLAPSSLGEDAVADPPPLPAMRAAAERGRLLHALFERLPALAPAERPAAAERWLAAQQVPAGDRPALIEQTCHVMARWPELFVTAGLAEAPIAAVLENGLVVSGTVDRLIVTDEAVLLVDYKTGRQVPADAQQVPLYHLRQMAAYAAALAVILPGRRVEAALLYTSGPVLIALPPALLAQHKPGFGPTEQS